MTSTNNYKKKLIEVAIPLEAINASPVVGATAFGGMSSCAVRTNGR